jgi:phosphopantetheinyl transferase
LNHIVVQPYEEIVAGMSPQRVSEILSIEDAQKAARFHRKEDYDRFVAARILLWQELQIADKMPDMSLALPLCFNYSTYGKPTLTDCPITFNWSHSGSLIALALGTNLCGIDIELNHSRSIYDMDSLCTPAELAWLENVTKDARMGKMEAFLILWSAKESALKTVGVGLSVDPRHVEISFIDDEPREWETTINGVMLTGEYRQITYKTQSYALAWCTTERSRTLVYDSRIS